MSINSATIYFGDDLIEVSIKAVSYEPIKEDCSYNVKMTINSDHYDSVVLDLLSLSANYRRGDHNNNDICYYVVYRCWEKNRLLLMREASTWNKWSLESREDGTRYLDYDGNMGIEGEIIGLMMDQVELLLRKL